MEAEQESFEKEEILSILEQEWCELDWFHKSLFEMYMALGSLSKVSKKTRIPLTSVSTYMKQSKQQIKDKIAERLKNQKDI